MERGEADKVRHSHRTLFLSEQELKEKTWGTRGEEDADIHHHILAIFLHVSNAVKIITFNYLSSPAERFTHSTSTSLA